MKENNSEKTDKKHLSDADRLKKLIGQEIVVEVTSESWGKSLNAEDSKPKVREEKGILEDVRPGLFYVQLKGKPCIYGYTSSTTGGNNPTSGTKTQITKISCNGEIVYNNPF